MCACACVLCFPIGDSTYSENPNIVYLCVYVCKVCVCMYYVRKFVYYVEVLVRRDPLSGYRGNLKNICVCT